MRVHKLTSRELSRRLGHAGNSFVSNVLTRKKPLPLNGVERWAAALELRGRAEEEFLLACCLELAPAFVQRVVRELIARAERG
jgi:hypothetical protein